MYVALRLRIGICIAGVVCARNYLFVLLRIPKVSNYHWRAYKQQDWGILAKMQFMCVNNSTIQYRIPLFVFVWFRSNLGVAFPGGETADL